MLRSPALWIKNTSALTLDRGSFSILESDNFSGQGLLEPVHPGERRLLSYASDTACVSLPMDERISRLAVCSRSPLRKGYFTAKSGEVTETEYLVHNAAAETRTVIVEVSRRAGWELDSDPKPEETAAAAYRFRVITQPNETVRLHVGQRHTLLTQYALLNTSDQQIAVLLQQDGGDAKVRSALLPVLNAKRHVAELDAQIAAQREETSRIDADQNRLRQNLTALRGRPKSGHW